MAVPKHTNESDYNQLIEGLNAVGFSNSQVLSFFFANNSSLFISDGMVTSCYRAACNYVNGSQTLNIAVIFLKLWPSIEIVQKMSQPAPIPGTSYLVNLGCPHRKRSIYIIHDLEHVVIRSVSYFPLIPVPRIYSTLGLVKIFI